MFCRRIDWTVASHSPNAQVTLTAGTTADLRRGRPAHASAAAARRFGAVCDASGESVDRKRRTDARVRIAPRLALVNGAR